MSAPRKPNPPRRSAARRARTLASTLLIYASLLVVIIIILLVWQSHSRRAEKDEQAAASKDAHAPDMWLELSRPGKGATRPGWEAATKPVGRAAGGPATRGVPVPKRASATGPPSNVSPSAIELSDKERIAFSDVADYTHLLDETAFYMLLGRGAEMPQLSPAELDDLPHPSIDNILHEPALFRAQAMRVKIRVFEVKELMPGEGLHYSRHWPKDKPVYRVHGLDVVPFGKTPRPMIVFALEDPKPLLGKPDKTRTSGDVEYHRGGRELELAAVFYKVYTARDRERNQRDYPVFVAWQAVAAGWRTGGRGGLFAGKTTTMLGIFIFAALLLLFGFLSLRRYIRQSREKTATVPPRRYRPLRDLQDEEGAGGARQRRREDRDEARDEDAGEIDPLLRQASEEYQRERQQRDGADDRGRAG